MNRFRSAPWSLTFENLKCWFSAFANANSSRKILFASSRASISSYTNGFRCSHSLSLLLIVTFCMTGRSVWCKLFRQVWFPSAFPTFCAGTFLAVLFAHLLSWIILRYTLVILVPPIYHRYFYLASTNVVLPIAIASAFDARVEMVFMDEAEMAFLLPSTTFELQFYSMRACVLAFAEIVLW